MEPEVDTNMKKCITYVLSPKRVLDPAYGKDWLMIDWLIDIHFFFYRKACLLLLVMTCPNKTNVHPVHQELRTL